MKGRRVVVTGLGLICPLGNDVESSWEGLRNGRSGIGTITRFDSSSFEVRIAGEVKDFDWSRHARHAEDEAVIGPNARYALAAMYQALDQAGLRCGDVPDGARTGVYLGVGEGESYGGITTLGSILPHCDDGTGKVDLSRLHGEVAKVYRRNFDLAGHSFYPASICALRAGVRGPNRTCLTACAASTQALGEAARLVAEGRAERMIAGGSHSMVTPEGIMGFTLLGALSKRNDEPEKASRPFDAERDGFILSEGAAVLILESLDAARARGAEILGEIKGYGASADAFRVTDPMPGGASARMAMASCLADAGMTPDELDCINAHGTSTRANDSIETQAIKDLFGDGAHALPVTSNKSMLGHLIAATGAAEAIMSLCSIRDGIIPPTINYQTPDGDCDLDYVPNEARKAPIRTIMSNSFGFGGQNATLMLAAFED